MPPRTCLLALFLVPACAPSGLGETPPLPTAADFATVAVASVPPTAVTPGPVTSSGSTELPTTPSTTTPTETDPYALVGWIGSPCVTDADCPYSGGVCLTDDFPDGMCSLACDEFCPDEEGYPVTFCPEIDQLPPSADWLGDGACVSRCDFDLYPTDGCRPDYGCISTTRANDPSTEVLSCMPNAETDLEDCYLDLAARGVDFEPTVLADDSPSDAPHLICHVEDPVYLKTPVLGVELRYMYSSTPDDVLVDCETAHAIVDTVEDLIPEGVVEIEHIGTYNCRTISGTSTLSQHALGRPIDLSAFEFVDGSYASLYDHWEHEDVTPNTWEGAFLYEASQRWYQDWIWNIILTPEYNAGHDNHFHVDLTRGSHSIWATPPRYIGPAPYWD